jgi:GrpB-like predicted nucleotidyltransferase (UPF0157 family)
MRQALKKDRETLGLNAGIRIVDHDPCWPTFFEREKGILVSSLENQLEGIKHIGSTAVPGLAAKPVIDIMLGLKQDVMLDACIEPLKQLGYDYISKYESSLPLRRYFEKKPIQSHGKYYTYHLHVVHIQSEFWKRHLLFRDYLRTHHDIAKQYEQVKKDLAKRFTDTNEYADAKRDFVESIIAKAERQY